MDAFDIVEGIERLLERPRYNIAPSGDPVPVVRRGDRSRELSLLRWPLLPHWAREGRIKFATANAKGETVQEKPAFRHAWRQGRRCLIPANGYYEWKKGGERKQPYHIQRPGRALFAFGGLWDRCQTNDGEIIESCTIITTEPAPALRPIHNRMPLIIPADAYETWLNGDDPARRIKPFDGELEFYPVSTFVNNPRNDGPRCIERTG